MPLDIPAKYVTRALLQSHKKKWNKINTNYIDDLKLLSLYDVILPNKFYTRLSFKKKGTQFFNVVVVQLHACFFI